MGMDAILRLTLETSGFKSGGQEVNKVLDDTKSKTESVDVATKRFTKTLDKAKDKFKLFGLIGLGTMAALFVNTPLMAAGFNLVRASLTNLFITIQKDILKVFKKMGNAINKVNKFLKENPQIAKYIIQLVALASAVALGLVFFSALAAVFNPVTLAIIAFGLLWTNNWGGIQDKTKDVVEWIKTNVPPAFEFIKEKAEVFLEFILELWENHGTRLVAELIETYESLKTNMSERIGSMTEFWESHGETILNFLGVLWDGIKGAVELGIGFVVDALSFGLNIIQGDWEGAWQNIEDAVRRVWGVIETIVREAINGIKILVDKLPIPDFLKKMIGPGDLGGGKQTFQAGGIVTRTGPILAHAGERVIPANQVGGGGGDTTILIDFAGANFNVSTPENIRQTARELAEQISLEQARMNRRTF